jgi:hypothetical protein
MRIPTLAQPSGCRIETRLDAWSSESAKCREKTVETSLDAADTSVRATLGVGVT